MPRPGEVPKSPRKIQNPLTKWANARKEKQQQALEQAARMVREQNQKNTLSLIDELCSVSFLRSELPARILDNLVEGYPICHMEWTTRALVQLLENSEQDFGIDIRPLDEKLLTLAMMFRRFVELGDPTAAQVAQNALCIGIQDIRCRLCLSQPDPAEDLVRIYVPYLERWISTVELALRYDRKKSHLDTEQAAIRESTDKLKAQLEAIRLRVEEDPSFAEILFSMLDQGIPEEPEGLDDLRQTVHRMLISARCEDFNRGLHKRLYLETEKELRAIRQELDLRWHRLSNLNAASDPEPSPEAPEQTAEVSQKAPENTHAELYDLSWNEYTQSAAGFLRALEEHGWVIGDAP